MKKKYMIIISLLYAILFSYCGNNSNTERINLKDIQYTHLNLDTEYVPMGIETCSYNGDSGVDNDFLYFMDHLFGFLYIVSPSGEILHRYLGLGNGPNEIHYRPALGATVRENELLILGGSFDAYLFKDFKNREKIQLTVSETRNSLEDSRAYTFFSVTLRKIADKFFYNIYSEAPYCNPVEHSKDYFTNAHLLMEVNLKSGEQKPIGNYSNYYINNHAKINHLFTINYDIDNKGNFYISFQADSLIYVYDKHFSPIKIFGFNGQNMDTNYGNALPNWSDFNEIWVNDHSNKGYYTWLKHIDATQMTMRSYQKGSHTECDGLQIYRGDVLIADVEVPKQFKVAGYIPPYYISQIICDEEAETMKFYKFKLD